MWNILLLALFINAEIEAQRSKVTSPRTHSSAVVEPSARPRPPVSLSAHYSPQPLP